MFIKNPHKKVSYSFRIDEDLLDDLKAYANATNRKLPETLNVLLNKQLEGITVRDTYLKNEKGTIITIPFELLNYNNQEINLKNVESGLSYEIKQIPNNLDIWTIDKGYVSPNRKYSHQGIELILIPELLSSSIQNKLLNDSKREMKRYRIRRLIEKMFVPVLFSLKNDNTLEIEIITSTRALNLTKESKKNELFHIIEKNIGKLNTLNYNLFTDLKHGLVNEKYLNNLMLKLKLLSEEINSDNVVKVNSMSHENVVFNSIDKNQLSNEKLIRTLQLELIDVKKSLEEKDRLINTYEDKFKKLDNILENYENIIQNPEEKPSTPSKKTEKNK